MTTATNSAIPAQRGWLLPLLALLFFFSGASGLIYQVLWLRMLGLVFGVTVFAASTVWASFMAGLAIGSIGAGFLGDRLKRPLVWFGAAEAAIGVTAFLSPQALEGLQTLYAGLYQSMPHSLGWMTFARFLIAFAVLIIPTALMGASLPLVVKSSIVRSDRLGPRVGLLYGTNTAGAIVGSLVAGLYLIPTLGIHNSFATAAIINALVGLVAIAVGVSGQPVGSPEAEAATTGGAPDADDISPAVRRLVLGVFAVSGFASLALEVIWFRVIVLVARPTVYGFSVMLATVLLGIALGSWLVAPLLGRRWRWLSVLAFLEIAMAFACLFSFRWLADVTALDRWALPYVSAVFPAYLTYPIAASVPAILPTTLLMGIAFPVGLRLWAGGSNASGQVASRIGVFYSLNVFLAIAGSVVAGFVLLPAIGSRWSLVAVGSLILGSGVALLFGLRTRLVARLAVAIVTVTLFVLAARSIPDPFDAFLSVRYRGHQVLSREESVQTTVSVHREPGGGRGLFLDGNHQASDSGGMTYVHKRIGHLGLALHPDPRAVLVVGLGGGATAGAASLHEGVEVDVVELSQAVVRGARFFSHINHSVLERPNVRLHVDDGRNYMMLSGNRYDVITADVILPVYAGSNNLYSAEYFRVVRNSLKPGGLVVQWVAGTEAEYKIIARTFQSVFPETTVWADGGLMVGSLQPLRLRREDFDWKTEFPIWRQALEELGAPSFDKLLSFYTAGPEQLRRFLGPGPILTDDRPIVEYFLSLPRDRDADLSGLVGDRKDLLR
jgi:spermidine synthase